jgi:23S rRNA pseudouridine1911/1915/1917 synthase
VSEPLRTLTVGEAAAQAPPRLDAYLQAALPEVSRRLLRRIIAAGEVRVNGRRAPKGQRLNAGDTVTLPDIPQHPEPEPALALPVVHEDAALVAVEKPGGMPSHALDPRQRGTAAAFVLARWPETARVGDALAPGLVHRLDTGTSGLLLAARTASAHAAVRAALAARAVEKRYLAVVARGAEARPAGAVVVALAHEPRDRGRMVAARPGLRAWPAETHLRVVAEGGDRLLVEAVIRTGVTHQVRAHLALVGYPVLGDVRYGGAPVDLPSGRHALHAAGLTVPHPADGTTLALTSALPEELKALLA